MSEKNPIKSPDKRASRTPEQQRTDAEHRERLREETERKAERSRSDRGLEASVERRNAERLADDVAEVDKPRESVHGKPERRRQTPSTKHERQQAYESVMSEARSQMRPAQRSFSKLIHHPVVESTSNAVGATIARPNAILAGSFTAFIAVLGVFLIARYYGYPLSGSESIVAFAGGWVLGIVFDYIRNMVTGRH